MTCDDDDQPTRAYDPALEITLTPGERLQLGRVVSEALDEVLALLSDAPLRQYVELGLDASDRDVLYEQPVGQLLDRLEHQHDWRPRAVDALARVHAARKLLEALAPLPNLLSQHTVNPVLILSTLDEFGGTSVQWGRFAREVASRLSVKLPDKRRWGAKGRTGDRVVQLQPPAPEAGDDA